MTLNQPAHSTGSHPTPPLVSVIIPLHNAEPFVGSAVRSVLEQTWPDLEVILVDDGSTDGSLEQCKALTDPRIRLIRQPKRGASAARNLGIRAARGRYLAFLDADDCWKPDKLQRHLDVLERERSIGLSFDRCVTIDARGELLGLPQPSHTLAYVGLSDLLIRSPIWTASAFVMRREALQDVERELLVDGALRPCFFDEALESGNDKELYVRLAATTGWQLAGIDAVLTCYRLNLTGITSQSLDDPLHQARWDRLLERIRTYAAVTVDPLEASIRTHALWRLTRLIPLHDRPHARPAALFYRALSRDPLQGVREPRFVAAAFLETHLYSALPFPLYQRLWTSALYAARLLQRPRGGAGTTP